jgi:hypothetical protein
MAKVNAPLFSFGATGKLGKSLVFIKWKGIAAVRQYLIPANPKSAGQVAQRTKLTNAVAAWHTVTLTSDDQTAWNALASLAAKPLSGFNQFVKEHIRIIAAGDTYELLTAGAVAAGGAGEIDVQIDSGDGTTVIQAKWGLKKTLLLTEEALTYSAGTWSGTVTGLTTGTRYFVQFTQITAGIEGISGIYEGIAG